ncbi:mps one binder kinase activator-like 3-like protein [Hyaloraphidium curvatum]|nr:mps one binder kinase activator-like 3-like protein [Hyaloraphidium curvatum]
MAEVENQPAEPRGLKRTRKGTKAEDWAPWPVEQLPPEGGSQDAIRAFVEVWNAQAVSLEGVLFHNSQVDPALLQYEFLRLVCVRLGHLVVVLEDECTPATCADMKADEWQFLCAAHLTPQSCPAIDYIIHTLDGATALLNSHKHFPLNAPTPESSVKHFSNIARRLYRIFAHCYFVHRESFGLFENETQLYARFLAFSNAFQLIPGNLLIVPENAGQ